jgi:hypothetical protein
MENFVKYGQTLKSLPLTTKAEAMTDHQQPSTSCVLFAVGCRSTIIILGDLSSLTRYSPII